VLKSHSGVFSCHVSYLVTLCLTHNNTNFCSTVKKNNRTFPEGDDEQYHNGYQDETPASSYDQKYRVSAEDCDHNVPVF
jgi:hypothetical protein